MLLVLSMPGMDGLELQQMLKNNHCEIPVIYLSG
jgi:FixJ family two-component response regulator